METPSASLDLWEGTLQLDSPHKKDSGVERLRFLFCQTRQDVNKKDAGDLRRFYAHVTTVLCLDMGSFASYAGVSQLMHNVIVRQLFRPITLQWRHNGRDGVTNHQPCDCFFNRLFQTQIKESIKAPRLWPLCVEFTGDRWIPRTNGQ